MNSSEETMLIHTTKYTTMMNHIHINIVTKLIPVQHPNSTNSIIYKTLSISYQQLVLFYGYKSHQFITSKPNISPSNVSQRFLDIRLQ